MKNLIILGGIALAAYLLTRKTSIANGNFEQSQQAAIETQAPQGVQWTDLLTGTPLDMQARVRPFLTRIASFMNQGYSYSQAYDLSLSP